MDLSRSRVVLRERGVLDALDLAVRFVVSRWQAYARTAVVVLPPFLAGSIALGHALGWAGAWTFAVCTAGLAQAPFTLLASRLVFEDDARALTAVREALRRLATLLALQVVTVVGGAVGAPLLVIPAVWVLTLTLFAGEVALVERADTAATLRRCTRLVQHELVEVIAAVILLHGLQAVSVLAADVAGRAVIASLLESRAPDPIWTDGWSVLSLAGFWLFLPYVATARFLVYLDVRTRGEGWDIQARFLALAALTPDRAPTSRPA